MRHMSIMKQLSLFSIFMIGIIAVLGGFTFWRSSQIYSLLDHVTQNELPAVRYMGHADMMHDGLRGVVVESLYKGHTKSLDGASELLKERDDMIQAFHGDIEGLLKLHLTAETIKLVQDSKPELKAYTDMSHEIVELVIKGEIEAAEAMLPDFHKSFSALEEKLEALGDRITVEATRQSNQGSNTLFTIGILSFLGISFGILLATWTLLKLKRYVKSFLDQVMGSGAHIQSVSERLSQANIQFSDSANETASSLQETVASLDELSSMVALNNENAKRASEVSIKSRESAEQGELRIRELSAAMNEIKTSSRKMEEIINVIDEIAFQTNLLALNAAVEAARAGEQGKGFAVVADAVRSLAQRSSSAAKDINSMIKESIGKIEYGGKIVDSSRDSLNVIFNSVKEVSELNHQISQASDEQSLGIKQISQAMNQLDASSQSNAAGAQEVSEITNEMRDQSKQLKNLIVDLNHRFLGAGTETLDANGEITSSKLRLVKSDSVVSPDKKNFGIMINLEDGADKPQIFDSKKRKISNLNDF